MPSGRNNALTASPAIMSDDAPSRKRRRRVTSEDVRSRLSSTGKDVQTRRPSTGKDVQAKLRSTGEDAQTIDNHENATIALEVDIMILDYQAYQTTDSLLGQSETSGHKLSGAVQDQLVMVDAFVKSFKRRHPGYRSDNALRLRLLLLQFCTLNIRRFTRNESTPSMADLEALRADSQVRVRRWIATQDRVPSISYDAPLLDTMPSLEPEQLRRNRTHVLDSLRVEEDDHDHYGSSASLSLIDLLPMFMQICALANQTQHSINVTSTMRLMTDFMLHASLEQYLVYGRHQTLDPIDEAFAWGCFADSENVENGSAHSVDQTQLHASDEEDVEMLDVSTALHNDASDHSSIEHAKRQSDYVNGDHHHARKSSGLDLSHDDSRSNGEQQNDGSIFASGRQSLTDTERAIDAMFRDETEEESEKWIIAKRFALEQLLSSSDTSQSALQHLQELASSYPVKDFDNSLREFLRQCTQLIDLPVLVQVERGKLSGMSKHDTKAFLKNCGLTPSGHLL